MVNVAREIEAKILGVDGKKLERKLRGLGAKKLFPTRKLTQVFFDFPGNSLKKRGMILRLCLDAGQATLCVKRKTKGKGKALKSLGEFEVGVSGFAGAMKILGLLGFVEKRRVEKFRTSFRLGSASIELDKLPGIPLLAEIEAASGKKVFEAAKRLGFSRGQLLPWNTFDVIRHYGKKRAFH